MMNMCCEHYDIIHCTRKDTLFTDWLTIDHWIREITLLFCSTLRNLLTSYALDVSVCCFICNHPPLPNGLFSLCCLFTTSLTEENEQHCFFQNYQDFLPNTLFATYNHTRQHSHTHTHTHTPHTFTHSHSPSHPHTYTLYFLSLSHIHVCIHRDNLHLHTELKDAVYTHTHTRTHARMHTHPHTHTLTWWYPSMGCEGVVDPISDPTGPGVPGPWVPPDCIMLR